MAIAVCLISQALQEIPRTSMGWGVGDDKKGILFVTQHKPSFALLTLQRLLFPFALRPWSY